MLKTLLKLRLRSLLSQMGGSRTDKTGKAKKRGKGAVILLSLLMLYCVAVYFLMFLGFFFVLGDGCVAAGQMEVYFGVAAAMAVVLSVLGSVFSTQSLLFGAKDNELLLSMPIKPRLILVSRLLTVVLLNLLFTLLVMLPCAIAAGLMGVLTVGMGVLLAIGALLLPLLSTTLCCLFGWLISLLTARVRNKAVVNMVFSLAFLAVFFLVYFRFQALMAADNTAATIAAKLPALAQALSTYLPVLLWFGKGVSAPAYMGLFVLAVVGGFALAVWLLSLGFLKLALGQDTGRKRRYTHQALHVGSVRGALLKKELRRFTSSAVYMMNCGLGLVLILIAAVVAAVKAPALLAMLPAQWKPFTATVATLILCFLGFANDITAPSVSLEGKSLWISQTLPIDMYHVLMAKVHLQLVLCAPVLLAASVVFAVVLRTDVQLTVLMVLLPQLMNLLNALFGLTMNLAFPKFDWANEAVPVKQGMALLLTMLSTMVYTIAPALLYFFALGSLLSPTAFLWIYGALTAVLSALLWRYLRTRGAEKYGVIG